MIVVGLIGAGAMGAGVGRRLRENGARVLTLLEGRSAATRARALAAGLEAVDEAALVEAELVLSIVPPGEAVGAAERLAPALTAAGRKPVVVDCNALDVRTVRAVEAVVASTGAGFVDGGIIGLPPEPGGKAPIVYLSGEGAGQVASWLDALGMRSAALDGPIGAASALKMSYAGITKGLTAVAAMMVLGAEQAGAGEALRTELAASQPELLRRFGSALPGMVPKAYRWVAEMREIAAFLGDGSEGAAAYEAFARLYDRIAADATGDKRDVAVLEAFAKAASERG